MLTTEQRPHARADGVRIERLGEEVDGARGGGDLVQCHVAGRVQEQQGHLG